jgi:hypothetical protein
MAAAAPPADAASLRRAPRGRRAGAVLLVVSWLALAVGGFAALARYDARPGPDGPAAPQTWPAASTLTAAHDRATLVVFLHPLCPCSRATVAELERLLAGRSASLEARAVVVTWDGEPESAAPDLRERLVEVPRLTVVEDDGTEASRFGATTSGTALLYDAEGVLRFRGGITPTRGHVGDNVGASAIAELVRGRTPAVTSTPVFGCALALPEARR